MQLIKKLKWWQALLLLPLSFLLWIFLTPMILETTIEFGKVKMLIEDFLNEISKHYILIIGFGVGTAVADLVLHLLFFGRGKSQFTTLASMSGTLMDELIMRLILLEKLLNLGLKIPTALFLQALSYTIYYLDPTSKNRMKQASLNLMHGIVIGTIALSYGWLLGLFAVWIRIILWKIENMISR